MTAPDDVLLYTLKEAERVVPYKEGTLRAAALKPADDGEFPHPLRAKRGARNAILIPRSALLAWIDALPDA